MKINNLYPNNGKHEIIAVSGSTYARYPVRTHVITHNDSILDVVNKYLKEHIIPGDIIFVSEKCVACSQKRAIPLDSIKPSRLSKLLSRFVYKSPYGIGLSIPETMEMALRECGVSRILFAAFIGAIGKLLGRRGWFYKVAGYRAQSIDGPTPNTIPPYNKCVVLGPSDPDKVAKEMAESLGVSTCIVDINDLAGQVLGASSPNMDKNLLTQILKDNPLGQDREQTPMGIIRKVECYNFS